jgi:hypothetical protein
MNRREFLKGIITTGLVAALGKPVYDSLLRREYQLTVRLDEKQLGKFVKVELLGVSSHNEMNVGCSIRNGWIDACVSVTDQYNRPWEIIGYFESLKSPEGWTIPLDMDKS